MPADIRMPNVRLPNQEELEELRALRAVELSLSFEPDPAGDGEWCRTPYFDLAGDSPEAARAAALTHAARVWAVKHT